MTELNYTDYRTNEPISREQYIASGLERGELVVTTDCGCVVIQDRTADAYIVYCYKHKAAPAVYEALKEIDRWLLNNPEISDDPQLHVAHIHIQEALTKAKPE